MVGKLTSGMRRLSLAQRFLIGSLIILVVGMAGIGLWVSEQIEEGVIHRTAATNALYVDSLVTSRVEELTTSDTLSADSIKRLDWLMTGTPLGQQVEIYRIWNRNAMVVYSSDPSQIGEQIARDEDWERAFNGDVIAGIGDIEGDTDPDNPDHQNLLEIYSPIREQGTNEIIAVAEFYFNATDLRHDIRDAERESWAVVGGATLAIYGLLAIFVQRASNMIQRQQTALAEQVDQLTEVARQNDELHDRVRGAAARTTALNERFLRRFSAELHDGPAQDISLALLQLDHIQSAISSEGVPPETRASTERDLEIVQSSLQRSLQEVRATSAGLLLPHLNGMSLAATIDHAVRAHRRRTGTIVEMTSSDLPEQAPLSTKIAAYRVIQEALENASRHAKGEGEAVHAARKGDRLQIEISDVGPGFDPSGIGLSEEHLGLLGMRERVESLGGVFVIDSQPGKGTRIIAELPLEISGSGDD
ncbi:sensor histidine kinase [soil metagenome]